MLCSGGGLYRGPSKKERAKFATNAFLAPVEWRLSSLLFGRLYRGPSKKERAKFATNAFLAPVEWRLSSLLFGQSYCSVEESSDLTMCCASAAVCAVDRRVEVCTVAPREPLHERIHFI